MDSTYEEKQKIELQTKQNINNDEISDRVKMELQEKYDTQKITRATKLNSFPLKYVIMVVHAPSKQEEDTSSPHFNYIMIINYAKSYDEAEKISKEFCKNTGYNNTIIEKFGEWVPLKSMEELKIRQENRQHPTEVLGQMKDEFMEEYERDINHHEEHEKKTQLNELETMKEGEKYSPEFYYDVWTSLFNISKQRHVLEQKLHDVISQMGPFYVEAEEQIIQRPNLDGKILSYARRKLSSKEYKLFSENYSHFKNTIIDHHQNRSTQ